MFFLQAHSSVVDVLHPRSAGFAKSAHLGRFRVGEDILRTNVLAALADVYKISPDPSKYVFVVTRALRADVPNCFVAGTRIAMANGQTMAIEDIRDGDEVLSHTGTPRRVLRTFSRRYSGSMCRTKVLGQAEALVSTANHGFPVRRNVAAARFHAYKALWVSGTRRIDIPEPEHYIDWDRIPVEKVEARGLTVEDFSLQLGGVDPRPLPIDLAAISDRHFIARLWGYYVAEGCPMGDGRIVLTLNTDEDAPLIRDIEENLPAEAPIAGDHANVQGMNGRTPYIDRGYQGHPLVTRVEITWAALARLFALYTGRGAHGKFIHPVMLNMPREWKLQFLAGYLQGDGCYTADRRGRLHIKGSTVSFDLLLGLQRMLASLDIYMSASRGTQSHGSIGDGNHIYEFSMGSSQVEPLVDVAEKFILKGLSWDEVGDEGEVLAPLIKRVRKALIKDNVLTRVSSVFQFESPPVMVYNIEVEEDHTYVANGVAVGNCNGDAFPTKELLRYDEHRGCQVYETFRKSPFHENHQAQDRTMALGAVLDAAWIVEASEKSVDCLVAIDAEKRPDVARDFESGRRDSVSMGCVAGLVVCSDCKTAARSEHELCYCLRARKMPNGPVWEDCYEVVYTELSAVADPAEKSARTRAFLGKIAARNAVAPLPRPIRVAASRAPRIAPIERMLDAASIADVDLYVRQNRHRMNAGTLELFEKVYGG